MEDTPSVLRKRKRSWTSTEVKSAREIIERHVELEVMLRLRALEVANAKIHWAEAIRETIVERVSQRTSVENISGGNAFLTESAQALVAIERSQPLREPHLAIPLPRRTNESPPEAAAPVHNGSPPATLPQSFEEESDIELPEGMPKPLFVQQDSSSSAEPVVVLISCEVCGRSDFPTIHSVLSHARMSHAIYYRGHEELVGRCGCVVTGVEAQRIRRYGTEASSRILLGMRSVIERGIGDARGGGDTTLLTKTLGLHADSAALASFLGRKPKVHSIRVYEPEGDIDIETVDHDLEAQQLFTTRKGRVARSDSTSFHNVMGSHMDLAFIAEHPDISAASSQTLVQDTVSRFHLKRRLIITDSSHFLSEKHRSSPEQTHQWMVTVSSPSYSEHITTFVSKLTVWRKAEEQFAQTPAQDHLHTTDRPPFSVTGFANEPFLAQVRLDWVGGPSKPLIVPHWVRLDASRVYRTVMGEDQTFDVELDRNTPFRPEIHASPLRFTTRIVRRSPCEEDNRQISSTLEPDSTSAAPLEGHVDSSFDGRPAIPKHSLGPDNDNLLYLVPTIKKLLPKIPMTSQDLRARAVDARTVSYTLPRSLNELLRLEHGRRKAYEWRHALSLKGALIKYAEADSGLSKRITDIGKLSTGELYRWMDAHEVFPRPELAAVEDAGDETPLDRIFCRFCGLPLDSHPEKLEEPSVPLEARIDGIVYDPPPRRPVICPEACRLPSIHRPPILDTQKWLDSIISCLHFQPQSITVDTYSHTDISYKDLVRWTNPELIRYVQDLTGSFCLPTFDALSVQLSRSSFSPGETSPRSAETDEMLGAYALLGQCLRIVVKQLVHHGAEAARELAEQVRTRRRTESIVQAFALGDPFPSTPEKNPLASSKQVLTPSHVLKGLFSSQVASHLRVSVGRLGIGETDVLPIHPEGTRIPRISNRKDDTAIRCQGYLLQ